MVSVVSLPIYADFGHFAYWPAPQTSVSKKVANKMSKILKLACDIDTGLESISIHIYIFITR